MSRIVIFIFKRMTGALAPFSYLVVNRELHYDGCRGSFRDSRDPILSTFFVYLIFRLSLNLTGVSHRPSGVVRTFEDITGVSAESQSKTKKK